MLDFVTVCRSVRCGYPPGWDFIGHFAGGKRRGLHTGSNNDETDILYYFGEWENDLPNGHGAQVLRDGTWYVGQFKDGVAEGQGAMANADGQVVATRQAAAGVLLR
jgi:hypothetical protein